MKITEATKTLLNNRGFKGETYIEANCFIVEDIGVSLCPTLEWDEEEDFEYYIMYLIVPDSGSSVSFENMYISGDTLKEVFEKAVFKLYKYE